ncbi:MAG: hypothetical protein K6V97_03900 [Actinomycetia bacterium]|nr:hypothetical protein [Actinomycetes bacterium]
MATMAQRPVAGALDPHQRQPGVVATPEAWQLPVSERTAQTYESLLKSYNPARDGQVANTGRLPVSGDEAMIFYHLGANPNVAAYANLLRLQKSYSLIRQSFLNGRALDFERALASTNLGAGYADGTALATLNLDTTMTSVLYDNQHLVLWNWLNRVPSINPLYQWTERDQYGSVRGGFGFAQGRVPPTGVAAWTRNQAQVCFFGVRRGITDVEAQSGLLGGVMVDPVQEEDRDGAFQLLGLAEANFTWADPSVTDNYGNVVNYPGIIMQMADGGQFNLQYFGPNALNGQQHYGRAPAGVNFFDLQGKYLEFGDLNNIAATLYQQGKLGSFANVRMFATPQTLVDLSNLRAFTERRLLMPEIPAGRSGIGFVTGEPIPSHMTPFGTIPFTASIFLNEVPNGQPITTGQSENGAPAQPGVLTSTNVTVGAPPAGVTSYFLAENGVGQSDAGTYYYWVSAVNDNGESAPVGTAAATPTAPDPSGYAVTVAPGQIVTLQITPGPSNGNPVTRFRIYRGTYNSLSDPNTTIIGHVAVNPNSPGTVTFYDNNSTRNGTSCALILERTPNNLAVAQLAPMTKYPLAIVETKVEWLLLLYHVLVVKARQRCAVIWNIGRFLPYVNT